MRMVIINAIDEMVMMVVPGWLDISTMPEDNPWDLLRASLPEVCL